MNFSCAGAEPGAGSASPVGTVRLASGLTAHYAYHSNRNAVADLARAGDALIALTDLGNFLRLNYATLELTREWFGPVPATCLGRGENGAVLAGLADGRICRIDPATLATTELARLTGKLQWVGVTSAGTAKPRLVAVVEQKKWAKDDDGDRYEIPFSVVHDHGSGKTYLVDPQGENPSNIHATSLLLDSKHRLWLGADNGEWGGWCSYVDLDAGEIRLVPGLRIYDEVPQPLWRGVVGFTELRDGQVWAYGGTTHMGMTDGFIWRVDQGKSEELYRLDNGPLVRRQMKEARKAAGVEEPEAKDEPKRKPDPPFPTGRPYLPITHVVEGPEAGAITVVSFSDIYRTDARLARWEKVHELKIGYRGGRPDAVGSYPSVRRVLPDAPAGKPVGLVFATRVDGLVRLAEGKETRHALHGQLGAEYVQRLEASSEGLLVIDGSDESHPSRFAGGAWSEVSFAPPYEPVDPNGPEARVRPGAREWHKSIPLVGRDGSIVTINSSGWAPGSQAIALWRNGKAEVVGREVSQLVVEACFLTPDGQIWNADDGGLRRLVNGQWSKATDYDWPRGVGRTEWNEIGWGLRAINDAGPPWILHDRTNELLLRLSHGPNFENPWLEVSPLNEDGQRLEVRDAISWTKGELLLATDRGLRTFPIDGGRVATPALDAGGRPVTHLVRDGRGRLWLGGEGLAVLEADGKTLHSLDELPLPGRSKIVAMAADPQHPDGAIASVEDRGVIFVRVDAR